MSDNNSAEVKPTVSREENKEPVRVTKRDWRNDINFGTIMWALFLIGIGLIFLLNNLGVLPWDIWGNLWRFWPIFLILIGLHIILGRSRLAAVLMAIITLVVCIAVVSFSALFSIDRSALNIDTTWIDDLEQRFNNNRAQVSENLEVGESEFQNVTSRELNIDLGSSKFTLEDNSSMDYLTLDAKYFENSGKPVLEKTERNGNLVLDFSTETAPMSGFFMGGQREYDLILGRRSIPTKINVDLGSGSGAINLDSVVVSSLDLDVSSGSLDVRLGDQSLPTSVSALNVSSGSLNLTIPNNVGLKVNYQVSSGSLSIRGNGFNRNGTYTSENFNSAEEKLEIEVRVSSGSLVIN